MVGEKLQLSVESIIGQSCRIEGNVLFGGGLRVDGIVRGNVCAEPAGAGYLVVSPKGRIEGCVTVGRVVVAGEVIGDLHVANKVEIQSQARIIGSIHYVSLAMQAGATVSGQLCHRNAPAEVADQGPLLKLV